MAKLRALVLGFLFVLSGCASYNEEPVTIEYPKQDDGFQALGNSEYYTHLLANELFSQANASRQSRYAVVGFVPLPQQTYQPNSHHPLQLLGHQLKEGLTTEASKRGFITQEFLLADDISVTEFSDSILTRNVEELSDLRRVDFFITGTILNQERGAMVNARIIHAQTKEIIAAATTFFPTDIFWQTESVSLRNGRLIRTQSSISNNN